MNGLDTRGVWFVMRQKRNMKMEVVRRLMEPAAATGERKPQILADEVVVPAKKSTAAKYAGTLRRVTAVIEIQGQMKVMMFMTNNLKWSARTVAEIYRDRWGIETFFKELKQTCQIHDFIGYSENTVPWQVRIGLLGHLILRYLRYISKWGLSFSRLAALVRGTLWNQRRLIEILRLDGTAGPANQRLKSRAWAMLGCGFRRFFSRITGKSHSTPSAKWQVKGVILFKESINTPLIVP